MRSLVYTGFAVLTLLALDSGCQGVPVGEIDDGGGITGVTSEEGSGFNDGTFTTAEEDTADPETGFPDITTGGTGPIGETDGDFCPLVDILFVIDNSSSMKTEQDNLAASVPGFIEAIEQSLDESNDYHVGVVATDAYAHNPEPCQELGALVTRSPEGECGPFAQGAFMTTEDALGSAFPCAAKLGTDGNNDEQPAAATIAALSPEQLAPGACNEGFLRKDALLIVVVITDEDDAPDPPDLSGSPGDPAQWFDALVDAKDGIETNIVVLGIASLPSSNCGVGLSVRLAQMIDMFTFGVVADVCSSDYGAALEDLLGTIQAACDGFTPPD